MIVINFKNYVFGKGAINLAKKIEKANKKAIVAVSSTDIKEISKKTKLKVYAQHVDYIAGPKTTGYILAESLKFSGARGTLINHSEHKISFKEIKGTVELCKKLNLDTVICIAKLSDVKKIMELKPRAIAYEDPSLISTGKSITKYKNINIVKFVKLLKNTSIIPLCGAGVSSREDIKEAYALGCKGALISSAIARDKKFEILNGI